MKLFHDQAGDEGLPGAQRRIATAAVMLGTTMAVLDGTIVNVALPSIAASLGVDPAAAVWVANGYLLACAMALFTCAALANRVGYRNMFVVGLSIFTVSSLGCALSPSLSFLTVMRVIQGLGGAAALSIAPALYRLIFPARLLGTALGMNALMVAVSTALGPAFGGALLAVSSWPWLFAINVPLGIVTVVLAGKALPRSFKTITDTPLAAAPPATKTPDRADSPQGPFDIAGAILSAIGMAAVILGADTCSRLTQFHAPQQAIGYGVLALASWAAFIWRQQHAANPLLPLVIFRSMRFSLAALTSISSFVGQGITIIALPFLLQGGFGYSAWQSALLFTPWPIAIIIAAPYAGRLADRHPPALLSTVGLVILTFGIALLAMLPSHHSALDICICTFVGGVGFGFFQTPNNREMLGHVSPRYAGSASAVLGVARTFGQSLGAAVVSIVLSLYIPQQVGVSAGDRSGALPALVSSNPTLLADDRAASTALWVAAITILVATLISFSRIQRGKSHRNESKNPTAPSYKNARAAKTKRREQR
jgi:DHA2 family multidrug resistance protein-like MFS transporter